jgi:protein-S-isoprenylcysteine O-methyltransferase Ste14
MTSVRPVPAISRRVLPPHWFFLSLLLEIALDRWAPIAQVIHRPLNYAGALLVAVGLVPTIWAVVLFRVVGTGVVPFSESTSLVTGGPYRFTRNPMYLGMVLVLLGVAIFLGAVAAFLIPPAFALLLTYLFILPEEGHMERTFGASFLERKGKVHRWL